MTKLTDEELQKLLRHHTSEPKVDRGSLVAIMTGQVSHTTLEKCMAIELLARRAAMREMVDALELVTWGRVAPPSVTNALARAKEIDG